MKKLLAALALVSSFGAQADDWGLYAGVNYWAPDVAGTSQEVDSVGFTLAAEHSLPLIPNVMLRVQDLSQGSNDVDMVDTTFYYQFFDNDLLELDWGLSLRHLEYGSGGLKRSETMPGAYIAGLLSVPGTNIGLFLDTTKSVFANDRFTDAQAGVSYTLDPDSVPDITLSVGIRHMKSSYSVTAQGREFNGGFVGATLHF